MVPLCQWQYFWYRPFFHPSPHLEEELWPPSQPLSKSCGQPEQNGTHGREFIKGVCRFWPVKKNKTWELVIIGPYQLQYVSGRTYYTRIISYRRRVNRPTHGCDLSTERTKEGDSISDPDSTDPQVSTGMVALSVWGPFGFRFIQEFPGWTELHSSHAGGRQRFLMFRVKVCGKPLQKRFNIWSPSNRTRC